MSDGDPFKVEIIGLERIQAKLSDPQLISQPLRELLTEAGQTGQRVAVAGIDGGTGIAVRSINYEVKETSMRTYSAMPRSRALNIEEGRPANDPRLSLGQVIRWKEAVGHPDAGIVIFQELRRRGVRGRFFMQAAKNTIQEHLPEWLRQMSAKIGVKWKE